MWQEMNGMQSGWFYTGYDSNNFVTYSFEVNFSPSFTVAQAYFNGMDSSGGAGWYVGVMGYRTRPDPNGPEQVFDTSGPDRVPWEYASYIYADQVSSVTFGTGVDGGAEGWGFYNLFFW
jgi:hypothetical protein